MSYDFVVKNNSGYSAVYSQYMNEKDLEKSMTDPELIESFMIDKGESPVGTKVKKNGMNLSFSNCFFKVNGNIFSFYFSNSLLTFIVIGKYIFNSSDARKTFCCKPSKCDVSREQR